MPRILPAALALVALAAPLALPTPSPAAPVSYEYDGFRLNQLSGSYAGGLRPRPGLTATLTLDDAVTGPLVDRTVFFRQEDPFISGGSAATGGTCPTDPGPGVCPTAARTAVATYPAGLVSLDIDFSDGGGHWPLDADEWDVELEFDAAGDIAAWDIYAANVAYLSFITSERGDESGELRRGPFHFRFSTDKPGGWPGRELGAGGGGGDMPPIPLPAGLPLIGGALAALALLRRAGTPGRARRAR